MATSLYWLVTIEWTINLHDGNLGGRVERGC